MVMRLTVICPTYNHEAYIARALQGFISQKTDFPFQALVVDDASTDQTPAIIMEYAARHPEIIKPVLRRQNLGPVETLVREYHQVDTEYAVWCEGDDYWVNENFLQMAVDFLDSKREYMVFAGDTAIHNCIHNTQHRFGWGQAGKKEARSFTLPEFFYLHTSARVFRNVKPIPRGDMFMVHYLLSLGPGWFHKELVSIYTYHGLGLHSNLSEKEQIKAGLRSIYMINKFLKFKYNDYYVAAVMGKGIKFKTYRLLARLFGPRLPWAAYALVKGFWNRGRILTYG